MDDTNKTTTDSAGERVLLTGATGFVGQRLLPALLEAGYRVRCCSRNPERAAERYPQCEWVRFDLADPESVDAALAGCDSALFLVHGMGADEGDDYPERERAGALGFREAAERHGLRRIVYLGGPEPEGEPSRHLKSRLETGEVLRSGSVSAIELRASMIVGPQSAGWLILRDLAEHLPAMILPRWLQNHSWPVGINDAVAALLVALRAPETESGWFDLPGPERISHKALLKRACAAMGRDPLMFDVPVLSPRLSSHWIGLVTRADVVLARELVQGLEHDLDPSGRSIWELAPEHCLETLDESIRGALSDEVDASGDSVSSARQAEAPAAEGPATSAERAAPYRVEAFFDGDCPLCVREVRMLRRLDGRQEQIKWTDIASSEFEPAAHGKTMEDFMERMHGRLPDGTWIEGVEVFRQLYEAVGFGPLVALSRLPGVSWLSDRAYDVFARNRLRLTGRCEGDVCAVPPQRSAS